MPSATFFFLSKKIKKYKDKAREKEVQKASALLCSHQGAALLLPQHSMGCCGSIQIKDAVFPQTQTKFEKKTDLKVQIIIIVCSILYF
jgi:hypothetical protein